MPNHRELSTVVVGREDVPTLFRARCSCGWLSEPIPASQTVLVWEAHYAGETRGRQAAS